MTDEDEPADDEREEATPGERLLYALGQLWWRWRLDPQGEVPPERIDIEAVARLLGVWGDVEYVQEGEAEDGNESFIHFAGEVLIADHAERFPWTLVPTQVWAVSQESKDLWRYFH